MKDCIFCKIGNNEAPSHKIWENKDFVAFLSIFPEVEGMTLVIPKKHENSYFLEVDKKVLNNLIEAAKTVSRLLDKNLEGVSKTKLVFEGLEIDHLHAKLYPMYRDGGHVFTKIERADDKVLADLAKKIRG
jgi:histidine triad (HIT) family protein